MTTIAHKPPSLGLPRVEWIGTRFVIGWSCTRRSPEVGEMGTLERVDFILGVRLLDHEFATIEAWLESQGIRTRTVLALAKHHCRIAESFGLLHIDACDGGGTRLLSLSVAMNCGHQYLLFAQTKLLSQTGFAGGAHDAPRLR